MSRNFTHYWKNETCFDNEGNEGELLKSIFGNQFRARDIRRGDCIYIVTVKEGELYLIAKLKVDQVVDAKAAAKKLGVKLEELADAEEFVFASEATPMKFARVAPLAITKKLRFLGGKTLKPPVFTENGLLDRQTLRTMRELDAASAKELDKLLPPMQKIP